MEDQETKVKASHTLALLYPSNCFRGGPPKQTAVRLRFSSLLFSIDLQESQTDGRERIANIAAMGITLHENRPIEVSSDQGIQKRITTNCIEQLPDMMAQPEVTVTPAANMIRLGSSTTCGPTTFKPDNFNKTDAQTAASSIHATLSGSTKLQLLGPRPEVTGPELVSSYHTDASKAWTTRDSSTPLALSDTQLKRPSPEQVSSTFPSELPPRPLSKRSFLQQLVNPFAHPTHAAHANETVSHGNNFGNPDIELSEFGQEISLHDADRSRSLKFWGVMLIGVVLSMAIGILIYSLVRQTEDDLG
ncbi:unnamed protein product [Alternaria sp. RS040]